MKIWNRRSNYFLFRVNAWAGITVLVLATTIHWDEFIAGYNLKRKNTVELDVPFLLSLSDKALPLLDTNIVALQKRENDARLQNPNSQPACDTCYIAELKQREQRFEEKQKDLTWLSWNYADDYTKKYFRKKGLITSVN